MKCKSNYLFGVLILLALVCAALVKKPDSVYTGPIIDMHGHIEFNPIIAKKSFSLPPTPGNLIKYAKKAKLTKMSVIVMAKKGQPNKTKKLNNRLLQFTRKNPAFFPICSVHPGDGLQALKEMERLSKQGVKVLKLHPNTQRFDVGGKEVAQLAKKAAKLKMVLLFDSYSPFDANQTGKFLKLAMMNPKTKFILAHAGGPKFLEFIVFHILKKYPWYPNNIWFDLSITAELFVDSPYRKHFLWVSRKLGADRLLFGSDFPISTPQKAIQSMLKLGFTKTELKKIFYQNAKSLLKL